jgi:phosphatidylserine decarboxylase
MHTMSDLDNLRKALDAYDPNSGFNQPWEDKAVDELYIHRHTDIGSKFAKEILDTFGKNDAKWHPGGSQPTNRVELMDWSGKSFMEMFTRKILPNKFEELKRINSGRDLALAAECWLESLGPLENFECDRFKKEAPECLEDLKKLGCKLDGYNFINCRLLLSYYHWIHSPCNGTLRSIIPLPKELNFFFGENNVWLLEIDSKNVGMVYLLIIGELNVQDFDFHVKEGDELQTLDVIGSFGWGSQIMVFFKVPEDEELCVRQFTEHYFIGDRMTRKKLEIQHDNR